MKVSVLRLLNSNLIIKLNRRETRPFCWFPNCPKGSALHWHCSLSAFLEAIVDVRCCNSSGGIQVLCSRLLQVDSNYVAESQIRIQKGMQALPGNDTWPRPIPISVSGAVEKLSIFASKSFDNPGSGSSKGSAFRCLQSGGTPAG